MLNREEVLNKLRNQIYQWNDKIIDYEKAAFKANHDVRMKINLEIERLKNRRNLVNVKLKKLEHIGDEAIENLIGEIENSLKDVKTAFSKASIKIHSAVKF